MVPSEQSATSVARVSPGHGGHGQGCGGQAQSFGEEGGENGGQWKQERKAINPGGRRRSAEARGEAKPEPGKQ